MSATTWCVVYNGGDQPVLVDEEGRTVYPTEFTHARRSVVRDAIDSGALMVVDTDAITDGSNSMAKLARDEVTRLNDAIDAEKAAAEEPKSKDTTAAETSTARKRTNT